MPTPQMVMDHLNIAPPEVSNTANGFLGLGYISTGNYNTAMGYLAMEVNQTGENNFSMGYNAGSAMSDGTSYTFIGYNTNCDYPGHATNITLLGNGAYSRFK